MENINTPEISIQPIKIPIVPEPIPPKSNIIKFFIISIVVLLLIIISFIFNLNIKNKKQNPIQQNFNDISEITPSTTYITGKNKSVLIYSEKINETNNGKRTLPVFRIYRVIDNGQPEVLVPSLKQTDSYITFVLSPDKQSLLINLENKIVMLNLNTKELTDILSFEYGGNVQGVTFSPNSQELFIWDNKAYSTAKDYSVYTYNIYKKEKKVLKKGIRGQDNLGSNSSVEKWRSDNKIIIKEAFGGLWVYDLETNKLEQKGDSGWLNDDGTIMAIPNHSVIKDTIKIENKIIDILAISPKNDQIIYSTKNLIDPKLVNKDFSNCNQSYTEQLKTEQYYIKQIGGESKPISEYQSILKTWKINLEAKEDYNQNYIQNGGQKITPSSLNYQSPLQIITQFYQY